MTTDHRSGAEREGPGPRTLAFAALGLLLSLFGAGLVAGVAKAMLDGVVKHELRAGVAVGVGIGLLIAGALLLKGLLPLVADKGGSPRTRKARSMLYLSMAIGAVLGAAISFGSLGEDPRSVWSGPVAPGVALFAIAVWIGAVPLLSWRWWRNIDEHEALAYKDGALAGMYAYSFVTPTWWMGWRGGFLPEPQGMATFLVVIAVWGLVWLARRYG